jgi:hypothetical protein
MSSDVVSLACVGSMPSVVGGVCRVAQPAPRAAVLLKSSACKFKPLVATKHTVRRHAVRRAGHLNSSGVPFTSCDVWGWKGVRGGAHVYSCCVVSCLFQSCLSTGVGIGRQRLCLGFGRYSWFTWCLSDLFDWFSVPPQLCDVQCCANPLSIVALLAFICLVAYSKDLYPCLLIAGVACVQLLVLKRVMLRAAGEHSREQFTHVT